MLTIQRAVPGTSTKANQLKVSVRTWCTQWRVINFDLRSTTNSVSISSTALESVKKRYHTERR